MPALSPRLVFAFLVSINFLLWSRSRYADLPPPSLRAARLVKRMSYELLHPNTSLPGTLDEQCRPLAFPAADQCSHVAKHCPDSDTILSIPYLQDYFCTAPPLRPLAFAGLLLWLFFLFSTLGITASDFFTPNLATIAQLLGLDENVAGVTFLAFGNGSPDVFSTFSAMRANSGSLAIGELLGAASFIISCVVGSMCMIKPFRVSPGPFLRDVGFFTVAVSLLLAILWDGRIQAWEAGLLVTLYVIYVISVVLSSWWERRQEWRRHTEALIRAEYQEDEPLRVPYHDDPERQESLSQSWPNIRLSPPQLGSHRARSPSDPPHRLRLQTNLSAQPTRSPSPTASTQHQIPSFSLVGALEFRQVVSSLQQKASSSNLSIFESPITPFAGGRYHAYPGSRTRTPRVSITSRDREVDPWDAALGLQRLSPSAPTPISEGQQQQEQPNRLLVPPTHSRGPSPPQTQPATPSTIPSIFRTPASPTATNDTASDESQLYVPPTKRQRVWSVISETAYVLFPSLHHFPTQSLLGKIASVFATPAVLGLTLTLPVVVTPYIANGMSPEKIFLPGSAMSRAEDDRLVDFEEEGRERVLIAEEEVSEDMHGLGFNKWLAAVQCLLGPLFCVMVLGKGTQYQSIMFLATSITGFAIAALVAVFAEKEHAEHPTAKMVGCSVGFFVAIVWIMAIADEVVNVLQAFGFIFGLSDAIIGLTIFAIGNSLADLVANMSVAVFAPIMGFSACFGSPMLNILLGVGLSGTFIISQTKEAYYIDFSNTLFVSTIGLLVLLGATLVVVPMNDYVLTRRWGVVLVGAYAVLMGVNVIVELQGERA